MREPGELAVKLQHAETQVFSGDVPPGAEAERMMDGVNLFRYCRDKVRVCQPILQTLREIFSR